MIPAQIERPNQLLVEGKEEQLFFGKLIQCMGLSDIQIQPSGGKTKLSANLKALRNMPEFNEVVSLGIVRDADTDPSGAFQSVHDALGRAQLPMPSASLLPAGTNPRVVVLILPAGDRTGALEDLCLEAVAGDPAMPCVKGFFDCLKEKSLCLPRDLEKAKVQAFLASRKEEGLRLGEAAEKGYWPWGSPAFDQIKEFLQLVVKP